MSNCASQTRFLQCSACHGYVRAGMACGASFKITVKVLLQILITCFPTFRNDAIKHHWRITSPSAGPYFSKVSCINYLNPVVFWTEPALRATSCNCVLYVMYLRLEIACRRHIGFLQILVSAILNPSPPNLCIVALQLP